MILICERFKVYVYLNGNIMEMVNLVLEKKKRLRKHCGNGKRLERARILKNCHQGSLFNDSNN